MFGLERYEVLFYGGIILVVITVIALIVFLAVHGVKGVNLRKTLDEEYGDPQHYNRENVRN